MQNSQESTLSYVYFIHSFYFNFLFKSDEKACIITSLSNLFVFVKIPEKSEDEIKTRVVWILTVEQQAAGEFLALLPL